MRLLGSELRLMLGRRRNQTGLLILGLVPLVLAIVVRTSVPSGNQGVTPVAGMLATGLYVPFAALLVEAPFFLPLAMAMLSADAIAGEANIGTLRYLLIVPVQRTKLLVTKFVSLVIGAIIGTGIITLVGLLAGVVVFGAHPLLTLSGQTIGVPAALLRILAAWGYLAIMMSALATLGLFVSTLTEQPLAATITVMITVILMWIAEGVPQLGWLHPWLLTHWFTAFTDLLRQPVLWSTMGAGLWRALGYVVVFGLAAWARFTTKDVTS